MAVRFPELPQPADTAETHIHQFFDHLIMCLNKRRSELLAKSRDTRLEMAARRAAPLREEKLNKVDTKPSLEFPATLEEQPTEVRTAQPETNLIFRGDTRDLEQLILRVGEVVAVKVEVPAAPQEMGPIATAKEGKDPGDLWSPNGVAIDSNTNQIYVAEGGYKFARVSIFSEMGKFLNSFSHEHMINPYGIAIQRENVYVTDNKGHFVFHFKWEADIRLVARLGSRGSDIGQFHDPRQLAVSTSGDVHVTDWGNHRIQIMDSDLYYKRHISHHTMKHPCDIKLTTDVLYVLSSIYSPCLHIFSHAGYKIRSLITCGDGMQVRSPSFFCLDSNENLFVSDCGDNRIKIFSKEGTEMHTLGQYGNEAGMFDGPQGIALTKNLKLVTVSLNHKYRLQIFPNWRL